MLRHTSYRKHVKWSYANIGNISPFFFGIYSIWSRTTGKCVYVGKGDSLTIRERLMGHWRSSHNLRLKLWIQAFGSDLDICYFAVSKDKIDIQERRLIRLLRPEANIQHNR